MRDGLNSLTRYYKNNFADGYRQVSGVDLMGEFSSIFLWCDCNYVSCATGFAGALLGSLHRPGWRMHLCSVSFGVRPKLALRYIPTCPYSRVLDADRACDLAIALHNGGIVVHAILGRHGSRHLRYHYPSRQAIRWQAEITVDVVLRYPKLCILYDTSMMCAISA